MNKEERLDPGDVEGRESKAKDVVEYSVTIMGQGQVRPVHSGGSPTRLVLSNLVSFYTTFPLSFFNQSNPKDPFFQYS